MVGYIRAYNNSYHYGAYSDLYNMQTPSPVNITLEIDFIASRLRLTLWRRVCAHCQQQNQEIHICNVRCELTGQSQIIRQTDAYD